jgi:hypothetical protein
MKKRRRSQNCGCRNGHLHLVYRVDDPATGDWYAGLHSATRLDCKYIGSGNYIHYRADLSRVVRTIISVHDTRAAAIDAEIAYLDTHWNDSGRQNVLPGGDGLSSAEARAVWRRMPEAEREAARARLTPMIREAHAKWLRDRSPEDITAVSARISAGGERRWNGMTVEERRANLANARKAITPEARSRARLAFMAANPGAHPDLLRKAQAGSAKVPREKRSASAKAWRAKLTPDERKAKLAPALRNLTREERAARLIKGRAALAARTPEQIEEHKRLQREGIRRYWDARRRTALPDTLDSRHRPARKIGHGAS